MKIEVNEMKSNKWMIINKISFFLKDKWKIFIWTDNEIGGKGARIMSEGLESNSTLTEINMKRDEIWSKMKSIIKKIKS